MKRSNINPVWKITWKMIPDDKCNSNRIQGIQGTEEFNFSSNAGKRAHKKSQANLNFNAERICARNERPNNSFRLGPVTVLFKL